MKSKEELLKELEQLGVDPTKKIRKPRSDAGEKRGVYLPRVDRGKPRSAYTKTAAKYKEIYTRMLTAKQSSVEDGADTLTRDANDIFPPNTTRYYKLYQGKDREYVSSVAKPAHIEQARWRWLMAEFEQDPDRWRKHIANLYFIDEDEIELWTYSEWAWAYVHHISGQENRLTDNPVTLYYNSYLDGDYSGLAVFDERGEIVWAK